jgi:hypothetical protein
MTLSPRIRAENLHVLMSRLISIVGDDDVYRHTFYQPDPLFSDILATSWGKLRSDRWLQECGEGRHRLTPIGWGRCLEATGKLDDGAPTEDATTTERLQRVAAKAKAAVKAVNYERDVTMDLREFATVANVPPGWLFNVIGTTLLLLRFKYPLRHWELPWIVEGRLFRIPAVFGHPVNG